MNRTVLVISLLLISQFFIAPSAAAATSRAQDDPAAKCKEGVRLAYDRQYQQAFPLLKVGVAGADKVRFSNPVDLAECAAVLGAILNATDDLEGAVNAYRVAAEAFRSGGRKDLQADYLSKMGIVHNALGRPAEAVKAFQQELSVRHELRDRRGEGKALNNIGFIFQSQGLYDEALKNYDQARAIMRELRDRAGEGTALNNTGGVYRLQGRYDEALKNYQQALAIARQVKDRAGEGGTLGNIGVVYNSQGRYAEALQAYQQALTIQREVKDLPGAGKTLSNIGGVYASQARYDEALKQYQAALALARQASDRASEGTMLHNIGSVYENQGRYDEALKNYQQALAILRSAGIPGGEGRTLQGIAGVYHRQRLYGGALENYQKALAIMNRLDDRAAQVVILSNMGELYRGQGRYAEALASYQKALTSLNTSSDQAVEGTIQSNIGLTYEQQGQAAKALEAYEKAMTAFESVRSMAGSDAGRAGFIGQYVALYDHAVNLYHRQGKDDQAFLASERGRARAFLDSLATGKVELSDDEAAGLLRREQETYAARQAAQNALVEARRANSPGSAVIANLSKQLATVEKEHQAALDAIATRSRELAALVPGRSSVSSLAQTQSLLDDQTTLVSYWVPGELGSLAFVVTRHDLKVVDLPAATSEMLQDKVDSALTWSNKEQAYPKPLRDLYSALVAPLKDQLKTPKVVIIPHQRLHYIPFAALHDGQRFIGEQYLLSVVPSASALSYIQQNAARRSAATGPEAVVFGNPTTGDPKFGPLVYAAAEAQAVAQVLGVKMATGKDASEALLRKTAKGSKVLHLAAHGSYDMANPLSSALHLAPGGTGTAGDGALKAEEIYGLDLGGTQLVTLSACESNVGQLSAGDELVGFTRAFLFAGTPTILSSLWSVDDEATAALMTAFYKHWQAGEAKALALQAAQAEIRGKPQWVSPFYWAGFVLNGDPGV